MSDIENAVDTSTETANPAVGGNIGGETHQGASGPLVPFMAQYEKNLQTNEDLASLGGHTEVAKAYLDLKGKLSNAIIKPSPEASDEDRNAYLTALGRPEDPNGYELSAEGFDEQSLSDFKNQAFEAGVPKESAEKIFNWYKESQEKRTQSFLDSRKSETDKAFEGLKKTWGDHYQENERYVKAAYEKPIPEDVASKLDDPGPDGIALGNSPWFMDIMLRVGKELAGDSLPVGEQSTQESEQATLKRRYPNSPELFK